MQSRRNITVIVASVFIGLLFAGAIVILVRGFLQFSEVESALRQTRAQLETLYGRKPFPSQANLKREKENIASIQQDLVELQGALGAAQVEPVGQSPAVFINQFFETQKELLSRARSAGVAVAKNYDFSFGRHMGGNLPASHDVPRLTQQLKIVELLCGILYKAGVSKLSGLARQEFEADSPVAVVAKPALPGRSAEQELKNVNDPNAGMVPPGQLYGRWHFVLQFSGRESAVMNVLNGLAKSQVFMVVTRLTLEGDEKLFERKEVTVAAKAGEEPLAVKAPPAAKDYRVVCGRDALMNVRLELDVYQFAKPLAADAAKKPGGVN